MSCFSKQKTINLSMTFKQLYIGIAPDTTPDICFPVCIELNVQVNVCYDSVDL